MSLNNISADHEDVFLMERFSNYLSSKIVPYRASIIKLILFSISALLIIGIVALKVANKSVYWRLIMEDGPIEYLTSLVYFFSFLVSLSIALQFHRQKQQLYSILYLFLSIGFLFICLEEISWGQRIFGVQSPDFFKAHNRQNEINLHNFARGDFLHGSYILVGAYGAFAFLLIPKKITMQFNRIIDLFVPKWYLILYFLPIFILYLYYDYLSPVLITLFGEQFGWERGKGFQRFIIGKDQEPVELILSIGFLLFVIINKYNQTLGKFDFSSKGTCSKSRRYYRKGTSYPPKRIGEKKSEL